MKRPRLVSVLIGLVLATVSLPAQDADFRPDSGVLNGRRYMNGYFGFSYRFPEGWVGKAIRLRGAGATQMYPLFSANPQAVGASDTRYVSINADFLPPNSAVKSPKDFLELVAHTQAEAFEALHTDKRYVFAGKQFYRVDMKAKPLPGTAVFYQTQISTLLRNHAVTFSFMASNSDDMEELVRTMESLTFFEPGQLPSVPSSQIQVASNQAPDSGVSPVVAPPRPVEVASSAPSTAPQASAESNVDSPASAPIATLAGTAAQSRSAVLPSTTGETQHVEIPGAAKAFVASAPSSQQVSQASAAQAPPTVTPASAQVVSPVPVEPAPSRPADAASRGALDVPSVQGPVSTVASTLPDTIEPLAPAAISASTVDAPANLLGASGSSPRTPESSAPVKSNTASTVAPVAITPGSVAAPATLLGASGSSRRALESTASVKSNAASPDTVTPKRAVVVPPSLAQPPSALSPERVSIVNVDASTLAPARAAAPSTLIQATHTPSRALATPAAPTSAPPSALVGESASSFASAPASAAPAATIAAQTSPAMNPGSSSETKTRPAAAQAPAATVAMNTPPPPISPAGGPTRVQVSAAVLESYITRKPPPVYPMVAKSFKVEGLVVVNVVVGRSGNVLEAKAVTGPPLLLRGAEDAVRQWRFKPYTVDGNAVEMESQIPMNFRLGR